MDRRARGYRRRNAANLLPFVAATGRQECSVKMLDARRCCTSREHDDGAAAVEHFLLAARCSRPQDAETRSLDPGWRLQLEIGGFNQKDRECQAVPGALPLHFDVAMNSSGFWCLMSYIVCEGWPIDAVRRSLAGKLPELTSRPMIVAVLRKLRLWLRPGWCSDVDPTWLKMALRLAAGAS